MDQGYARPTANARALRSNAAGAEHSLWRAIGARKISGRRFNRQLPIDPFICDLAARSIGSVIEVHGLQHDMGVDADPTRYIETQGFRVIRFWNNDVLNNIDGVVGEIERVIADMPSTNPSRMREGSHWRETS
ncbi:very-short-patch-repair endonuclease [Sphingobium sp. OAS761]|uniref:DUF559 domain-containing protein n=1 Tax=Sphingobium sp. OAS761 TaxID=2817901 RepID=UPI00209FB3D9|nr:DUF559 domain-containing protein [Sphingobium sp. OAS761]MCP1470715.1 very-short-patch-repair endonuclease [Sphingobium sp. OAS761]